MFRLVLLVVADLEMVLVLFRLVMADLQMATTVAETHDIVEAQAPETTGTVGAASMQGSPLSRLVFGSVLNSDQGCISDS